TKDYVMLAGNPARFIKRLTLPATLQVQASPLADPSLLETMSKLPNEKQS
ncbi:MAG: hypothetical protein ACI952_000599, partial [Flavobacteriales bacterium]